MTSPQTPSPKGDTPSGMGTLYGVGVGPGDPDLITLKAARLLETIAVVAFPANPQGDSQALTIAERFLNPAADRIAMQMAFTVDRVSAHAAYDAGAQAIGARLKAGQDVAVLCEGDPMLFGSFAYVLQRLCTGGPGAPQVDIIPGVSSLTACAAAAAHPLALGNEPLVCLPATLPAEALEAALSGVDAVAVFKIGRHLPKVRSALEQAGLADGAVCVVRAGYDDQKRLSLDEACALGVPYFSLLLARRARTDRP